MAVLKTARGYIHFAQVGLRFVSFLTLTMVIFTCLLICYNPRDDLEIELLKTGVMTEEDIETIKKLKLQRNFSYEKGNEKGRRSIDLDTIHATRSRSSLSSNSGLTLRLLSKHGNRVHPIENSSP